MLGRKMAHVGDEVDKPDKINRIKEAVRSNFEQSPTQYEEFEERHGFFAALNARLLSTMTTRAGMKILDIGCGTGAGVRAILDLVPDSVVVGLDNSPAMLEAARRNFAGTPSVRFLESDAAELETSVQEPMDLVVYSASIFLIPDYRKSLAQVRGLLVEGGEVGLTFMTGVYDESGQDLLELADRTANLGVNLRKAVKLPEFQAFFSELFPANRTRIENFPFPAATFVEFFSIPAMSAGLFPGLAYKQRVRNVRILAQHFSDTQPYFRWTLMTGRKAAE